MHRFLTEIYKENIAANDIGLVSYGNENYVLDLWGLASNKAFQLRSLNDDGLWMQDLANEYNVKLVMIYSFWFKKIPEKWILLGVLQLNGEAITEITRLGVTFYWTDENDRTNFSSTCKNLKTFKDLLPKEATFLTSSACQQHIAAK